ncbi:MAG: PmoA family protein [Verrucomicrobia bacterium]|nr:PmoA family protein [Verrucomicrobiota bacterium]
MIPHKPNRSRFIVVSVLCGAALCTTIPQCHAALLATIRVEAGDHDRVDTPFSVELAVLSAPPDSAVQLKEVTGNGGSTLPAQITAGNPPQLGSILSGRTPSGTARVFQLVTRPKRGEPGVRLEDNSRALIVSADGMRVLAYNHAIIPPPPGASRLYNRSGFIHPLWSPEGKILTHIHPADHIHHVGLWGPWTKTEYAGNPIDFWNLTAGQGTVRFARFLDTTQGPVYGGFRARQDHVWLKAPEGERVVLYETLGVTVWSLPNGDHTQWLMDYTSTYRCATDQPLHLEAYRYGGLGFRGTGAWHNGNSDYLTSEGKSRRDGDATRARWCDVFGDTDQSVEGVVFMSHPENRSHPEPVRIWPPDSNNGRGDVFFNFCPVRETDWTFEPGEDYVLRYRLYGHSGKLDSAVSERLWRDFAEPPRATLLKRPPPGLTTE